MAEIQMALDSLDFDATMALAEAVAPYVDILEKLINRWEIDKITNLTDEAEKARDYLMKLPARMMRLTDRVKIPENSFEFKWVEPAKL